MTYHNSSNTSFVDDFLDSAVNCQALTFGEFRLKSSRISPYFFNSSKFMNGENLVSIARAYANCIINSGIQYDVIFGSAYKGIPLVSAVAVILKTEFDINVNVAYDRKEQKSHGEGGMIVDGREALNVCNDGDNSNTKTTPTRVLLLDDVMTAGTAILTVIELLKNQKPNCVIVGVVISLDRQESSDIDILPFDKRVSAVKQFEKKFGIPVLSIATLTDLLKYIKKKKYMNLEKKNLSDCNTTQNVKCLEEYQLVIEKYFENYGTEKLE